MEVIFKIVKPYYSQIGAVKFTLFKGALFIHEDDVKKCAKNTVAERAQRAVTSETHASRKSNSKSRTHFHHFDSRWCTCSQHKQIHAACVLSN